MIPAAPPRGGSSSPRSAPSSACWRGPSPAHAGGATQPGASRTVTRIDPHERAWVLRKVASLVANDPEPRTVSNPCK